MPNGVSHTPGPWIAVDDQVGTDDALVAEARLHDGINPTEWQANLHLIAAAPELLALVYQYRDDMRHGVGTASRARRLESIEAVIAKTEGR